MGNTLKKVVDMNSHMMSTVSSQFTYTSESGVNRMPKLHEGGSTQNARCELQAKRAYQPSVVKHSQAGGSLLAVFWPRTPGGQEYFDWFGWTLWWAVVMLWLELRKRDGCGSMA